MVDLPIMKKQESFGIRPGDAMPDSSAILTAMVKCYFKSWDNRYGVLMVSELAQALSGQSLVMTICRC